MTKTIKSHTGERRTPACRAEKRYMVWFPTSTEWLERFAFTNKKEAQRDASQFPGAVIVEINLPEIP